MSCERGQNGGDQVTCPPRMSDARLFTHYEPRCFQQMQKYSSSYQMRQELQRNAAKLIHEDRVGAFKRAMCEPCFAFSEDGTMLPEQTKVTCTKQSCSVAAGSPAGLGQGRDYGNNLKPLEGVPFYPIEGMTVDVYDTHAAYGDFMRL